jgi:hypothetical protein
MALITLILRLLLRVALFVKRTSLSSLHVVRKCLNLGLLLMVNFRPFVSFQVIEDWKFIAMVLDRLFLFLFMAGCLGGTGGIILRAPSLYDTRKPIGATHSLIYARD